MTRIRHKRREEQGKNVTLRLGTSVLRAMHVRATEENKSLSQYVEDLHRQHSEAGTVEHPGRAFVEAARRNIVSNAATRKARSWSRDDAHARRGGE